MKSTLLSLTIEPLVLRASLFCTLFPIKHLGVTVSVATTAQEVAPTVENLSQNPKTNDTWEELTILKFSVFKLNSRLTLSFINAAVTWREVTPGDVSANEAILA